MMWKSGLIAVAISMGWVSAAGQAVAVDGAGHEKTYSAPGGLEYTVGHTEHAARPVGSPNGMPTNRVVYLDNTVYGEISDGAGRLKTGYFVACAVDLSASLNVDAGIGIDAGSGAHVGLTPAGLLPGLDVSIGPSLGAGVGVDLSMAPGEVVDVPVGERELFRGSTGYVVSRDRRIQVQDCAGPLTVQAYALITVDTMDVTAEGAVFGDPFVL